MLSEKERNRYDRHLMLQEIGLSGQEKLKAAKVLVIGAGGLGCPALQYLAAAGTGLIGVIDFDVVETSNLQRQVLFGDSDVGQPKVHAAKKRLLDLNPLIRIRAYHEKLSTANALELFAGYDIILDGTDNFETRYLVNDACIISGKPLVYGSIYRFEGQVSVFNYQGGPSYRCLFPEPPLPGSVPSCAEAGVMGVLPGIIGSLQANEAIKMITVAGEPLNGKLLLFNALSMRCDIIHIRRNEQCIREVLDSKDHFSQKNYAFFCGTEGVDIPAISIRELKQKQAEEALVFLDVREYAEQPRPAEISGLRIPLGEIAGRWKEIPRHQTVVVYCRSGVRSAIAVRQLMKEHGFTNLLNLEGGILQWMQDKHQNTET